MHLGLQLRSVQPRFKLSALRRKNELLCRIDMWGFVSVMLALLFLFMWRAPDVDLPRYAVDQAVAANSTALLGALREDAMQISITRDGRVFFRKDQVMLQNLPEEIQKALRAGAEKRIYLNADARAKYADVMAVLEQIRLAGIGNVSFLTAKPYSWI